MKYIFSALLFLVSNSSALGDCRLNSPLDLKGTAILVDPQSSTQVVTLRELVFDKAPTTEAVYLNDPNEKSKPLVIDLFAVRILDKVSSYLGANLHAMPTENIYGTPGAGISVFYFNNDLVKGSVSENSSGTLYETQGLDRFSTKAGQPDPVTLLRAVVANGHLEKLELTLPIDKAFKKGNYHWVEYQGADETLCLKSARLFVDGKPLN